MATSTWALNALPRWSSHVLYTVPDRPGTRSRSRACTRPPLSRVRSTRPVNSFGDAFHVVALAGHALDEVRRRVQQETLGHRGRSGDPLYGIRNVLRCAAERLTDKQQARLAAAIAADERHDAVHVAWQCAQRVRAAYAHPDPARGRQLAEQVVDGFPSCPIPEIARLGRTLKQWRDAFLAYFDTGRASNGGTESINGLIELHRRIARGFRNRENYRLRMLLIGGGLTVPPPQV